MEKRIIEIEVPMLVPYNLTPNRKRALHWAQVTRLKNAVQAATFYAAHNAKNQWLEKHSKPWIAIEYATIKYHFIVADKRSIKDDDNAIAGAKYMLDVLQYSDAGIMRAGIIVNDKGAKIGGVEWIIDKERAPLTIIEVIERDGQCQA